MKKLRQFLIIIGTDINQILQLYIDTLRTPLGLAIDLGHMEIIDLLLNYKQLNVNDSGTNRPPISLAILKNRTDIIIRLMDHKRTRKSDVGEHFSTAIQIKYKEGIRLLIDFIYDHYQDYSTLSEYDLPRFMTT